MSAKLSRRAFAAGTAALMLSACGGLGDIIPKPQNLQIYTLRPTAPPAGQSGPHVTWQLAIAVPDAPRSLDTERIALSPTPDTMDYYANARWPDRAPLVLQSALVEAFQATGRIPAVSRDTSGLTMDYMLKTDLREFQARYDSATGAPTVSVRIAVTLVQMPEGRIVKSWEASRQVPAKGTMVPDIIAAFDGASGDALAMIVETALNAPPPVR